MNHFPRLLTAFCLTLGLAACDATIDDAPLAPEVEDSVASYSTAPTEWTFEQATEYLNMFPCLADYAEPDDRIELAASTGYDAPLSRSACADDVDFFSMDLEAGAAARVVARFNRAEGDIEVMVSGPDGKFMASSEIRGDRAEVEFEAAESGAHRIVVVLTGDRGGADGTTYSLRVRDPFAACSADSSEPNDGSDASAALAGEAIEQMACEQDEDWFEFEASAGDRVRVAVDSEVADGDVDFALYGPDGAYAGGAFGNDDYAVFETTADEAGTWRVLVYLAEGSTAGVAYDVYLSVDDGGSDGQQ